MTETAPAASIPVAWLRRLPADYKIPLWRWIVLPATTLLLKRNGGAWVSGTLTLAGDALRFEQARMTKSRRPSDSWMLALADIADIAVETRLASDRIEIRHAGGTIKLMAVRSADFIALLRDALAA